MSVLDLNCASPQADADLINASRRGDRQAFGQIVRKYQGMITGLLFATCGDIDQSEDLAQETFISAWKSLSGLREPGKLRAWLCQIARHRLMDLTRNQTRERIHLNQFTQQHRGETHAYPADQKAISDETRKILWETLCDIPQPYRETLVLYYRQGKSTADVAAAMETTEESVRQRLSRGRQMLREQVAEMIERDLVLTAPNNAYTLAVVAALPVLTVQSAKAATLAAAAKGAGTSLGASILWTASIAVAPIMGLFAFIIGTRAGMKSAETPRERRFVLVSALVLLAVVLLFIAANGSVEILHNTYHWSTVTSILVQSVVFVVMGILMAGFSIWRDLRHRTLRRSEGLNASIPAPATESRLRSIFIPATTFGALGPLAAVAFKAHDEMAGAALMLAIVLISAATVLLLRDRSSAQFARGLPWWGLAMGLTAVVITNLRLYSWLAVITGTPVEHFRQTVPVWALNLEQCAIIFLMETMLIVPLWLRGRNLRQDSAADGQLQN